MRLVPEGFLSGYFQPLHPLPSPSPQQVVGRQGAGERFFIDRGADVSKNVFQQLMGFKAKETYWGETLPYYFF